MNVPGYLQRMVKNYFRDRILKYHTDDGLKTYVVTGGVPEGSVLGPLLWNIMYDGLLRLKIRRAVTPVAFADDIAIVIVAKHPDELVHLFNITFEGYQKWLEGMGQKLAGHKTECTMITSRKAMETVTLRVGKHEITSQLRYLGGMIDSHLNFKAQVEHASAKAATVGRTLSKLMPNVGNPKQKGAPNVSDNISHDRNHTSGVNPQHQRLANGKCVPHCIQRGSRCHRWTYANPGADRRVETNLPAKESREKSTEEIRVDDRRNSITHWQTILDGSIKGRWTHGLISKWIDG